MGMKTKRETPWVWLILVVEVAALAAFFAWALGRLDSAPLP